MRIGRNLLLIVALTITEVSLTVGAALQISKGATFHQLNFLHLKYTDELGDALRSVPDAVPTGEFRTAVLRVRDQPVACLELMTALDREIMSRIGTAAAISLCRKDLADADRVLATLGAFDRGERSRTEVVAALHQAHQSFRENSAAFEDPIVRTVAFTMRTMIPMVLLISLFNIIFIAFLSRRISQSIGAVIGALRGGGLDGAVDQVRERSVGEMRDLLDAATEQIRREVQVEQVNQLLEVEVAQRTESLTRANEELTQFAYRASHDLSGPLSTIASLCRATVEDLEDGDVNAAQESCTRIGGQAEKLQELVVGILELARADLEQVEPETFTLGACIDDVVESLGPERDAAGVDLRVEVAADAVVQLQQARLRSIVVNLVANGIKYRAQEREAPFVKVVAGVKGGVLELVVEDNGVGVPVEHHETMFARFKRFHPGLAKGSGLGLSIVQRHVEQLGGSIEVEALDEGTRFVVSLPLRDGSNSPG